jgi:hypothetical protein
MAKKVRKKKSSKKYDLNGKDDYSKIPVAAGKREACAPILAGVKNQIDEQLSKEHAKQEGLRELIAMNEAIDQQLRAPRPPTSVYLTFPRTKPKS